MMSKSKGPMKSIRPKARPGMGAGLPSARPQKPSVPANNPPMAKSPRPMAKPTAPMTKSLRPKPAEPARGQFMLDRQVRVGDGYKGGGMVKKGGGSSCKTY